MIVLCCILSAMILLGLPDWTVMMKCLMAGAGWLLIVMTILLGWILVVLVGFFGARDVMWVLMLANL